MFFILPVLHTHFPKITLQISSKLTHLFISYSIKQHEENFYYFSNNFDLNNINNQKHSNIDNSNFENPKRVVKLDVILEDKTKSDNLVSPNRSSWLNNYEQFQNSVDFNKEIAHNVTLSNKSTNSKDSTNISFTKDRSNESVRDQITSSQYLTEPSINSNQKNLLETEKLSRTDRPNAPTTTIIGDSTIKKVFGDKLSRQLNYKYHMLQFSHLVEPKHNVWKITSSRPRNFPQNK